MIYLERERGCMIIIQKKKLSPFCMLAPKKLKRELFEEEKIKAEFGLLRMRQTEQPAKYPSRQGKVKRSTSPTRLKCIGPKLVGESLERLKRKLGIIVSIPNSLVNGWRKDSSIIKPNKNIILTSGSC